MWTLDNSKELLQAQACRSMSLAHQKDRISPRPNEKVMLPLWTNSLVEALNESDCEISDKDTFPINFETAATSPSPRSSMNYSWGSEITNFDEMLGQDELCLFEVCIDRPSHSRRSTQDDCLNATGSPKLFSTALQVNHARNNFQKGLILTLELLKLNKAASSPSAIHISSE